MDLFQTGCRKLIEQGVVCINGRIAQAGMKVMPQMRLQYEVKQYAIENKIVLPTINRQELCVPNGTACEVKVG